MARLTQPSLEAILSAGLSRLSRPSQALGVGKEALRCVVLVTFSGENLHGLPGGVGVVGVFDLKVAGCCAHVEESKFADKQVAGTGSTGLDLLVVNSIMPKRTSRIIHTSKVTSDGVGLVGGEDGVVEAGAVVEGITG